MPKKKPQFSIPGTKLGQPEKTNWIAWLLFLAFVICGLCAAVWLFNKSPLLPTLNCDTTSGTGTLTSWGGCHEE
jgi:hypothetical protein